MDPHPFASCRICTLLAAAIALAGCSLGDVPGSPDIPAGDAAPGAGSRCQVTEEEVTCTRHERAITAIAFPRTVHYELPIGAAPLAGWPAVLYFQGSFVPAGRAFHASRGDAFGQYQLSLTVKALLDAGYAVLAPEALGNGTTAWQTNIPPWSALWGTSSDDAFMRGILQAITEWRFGPIDSGRLYAMGISSGGFMTSRMAVSYRGRFRALAVHSGSYATCSALCVVPRPLPDDHPPTLFLHGGADVIVPVATMAAYRDELVREGRTARAIVDDRAGHEWLAAGAGAIPAWFGAYP